MNQVEVIFEMTCIMLFDVLQILHQVILHLLRQLKNQGCMSYRSPWQYCIFGSSQPHQGLLDFLHCALLTTELNKYIPFYGH